MTRDIDSVTLTFRPRPLKIAGRDVPLERRLKSLLKVAGRAYGFQCTNIALGGQIEDIEFAEVTVIGSQNGTSQDHLPE